MTQEDYAALALSMPEAVEGSHFDVTDFRVAKKIFATLRAKDSRAVLKLSPDEQAMLCGVADGFAPVKGGWGDKGWTQIDLQAVEPETLRHAMQLAWRNVAPKRLL